LDIIDFLERFGQEGLPRGTEAQALEEALAELGSPEEVMEALTRGDRGALEALTGATPNVCCAVAPPHEEDEEEEESEEEEEEPTPQEKVKPRASRIRRVA
jgi:hypothetical protein